MNTTDYKPGPASLFAGHARRPLAYRNYTMYCMGCGGFTAHEPCDDHGERRVERYKCLRCNVIRTVRW